jgi:rod shape-determining protein MreD
MSVVVIVVGLLGGAVLGAVFGFSLGLLVDAMLIQTFGVLSLVLLTVGYLAGRWREGFDITSSMIPPLLAGGLTIVGGLTLALIQLTLGVDAPISLAVLPEIFAQGVIAVALGAGVYPLIRRLVAPALIEDSVDTGVPLTPMRAI